MKGVPASSHRRRLSRDGLLASDCMYVHAPSVLYLLSCMYYVSPFLARHQAPRLYFVAQCRVHKRTCSKKEMGPEARHRGYCLLLVSLFSPSFTLCLSRLYIMPNTTSPKLRSGFVISLDACLRYLGSFKGHGFSFANVRPSNSRTHNLLKEMCDEERGMGAQEDLESAQIERVHDYFRHLRRKAPEELRVRLVLPHSER